MTNAEVETARETEMLLEWFRQLPCPIALPRGVIQRCLNISFLLSFWAKVQPSPP